MNKYDLDANELYFLKDAGGYDIRRKADDRMICSIPASLPSALIYANLFTDAAGFVEELRITRAQLAEARNAIADWQQKYHDAQVKTTRETLANLLRAEKAEAELRDKAATACVGASIRASLAEYIAPDPDEPYAEEVKE